MARILHEIPLPFVPLADDEIMAHAEALADGRDAGWRLLGRTTELQDDEIGSHLEEGEMVFAMASTRGTRRRRPVRH